jgi:hypothetical protein
MHHKQIGVIAKELFVEKLLYHFKIGKGSIKIDLAEDQQRYKIESFRLYKPDFPTNLPKGISSTTEFFENG